MQLLANLFTFVAGFGVIGKIVGFLASVFWGWMLFDAALKPSSVEKVVWVLVVILPNVPGAILYCLIGRGRLAKPPTV